MVGIWCNYGENDVRIWWEWGDKWLRKGGWADVILIILALVVNGVEDDSLNTYTQWANMLDGLLEDEA